MKLLSSVTKLLICLMLASSCERLDDSLILDGELLLNGKKLQLNRGSIQYSDVIKTLSNGNKQHKYSFYRLNINPNPNDEIKASFTITAYDRLKNNLFIFSKNDIEIKLIQSLENQTSNFRTYDNIIDAKFNINNISKRNIVEGTFAFKIVSNDKSFSIPDTLIIEHGVFKSKLETFETADF